MWERSRQQPTGDYRYVDIVDVSSGVRYIVEVHLAACFEMARPTDQYTSLLSLLPPVFVGRPEELKKVVRLMCGAMKESLKSSELALPPWRRKAYVQSKWFGHYKRTTDTTPRGTALEVILGDSSSAKKSIGHVAAPKVPAYRCREDLPGCTRMRVGQGRQLMTATFCRSGQL